MDCHVDVCSPEVLVQLSDNFDYQVQQAYATAVDTIRCRWARVGYTRCGVVWCGVVWVLELPKVWRRHEWFKWVLGLDGV